MNDYIYADITITPHSQDAADLLAYQLGEAGYEAFEPTDTGLRAYIPSSIFNRTQLQKVVDDFPLTDLSLTFSTHILPNKDWNEEWERAGFDPVLERECGIKLKPRMAFGSGAHETTRQIVRMILADDLAGQRTLDMGTGTGVLAIAMAMSGAAEVAAIDIDPFSVENARENIALNNLSAIQVTLGDASTIRGQFHTIAANIHKNILLRDLPAYVAHLHPGGKIIMSGFYTADIPDMAEAALAQHLRVIQTAHENDWAVLILQKD